MMPASNRDLVDYFDYLCLAREKLFGWIRNGPVEMYTRSFPVGHGTISTTLVHIARSQWGYTQWLSGRSVTAADNPLQMDKQPPFEELATIWTGVNPQTRQVLADLDRDRYIEWVPMLYKPPMTIRINGAVLAGQLIFHEIHHRAQVMMMLRHAGVTAETLDYALRSVWEKH
ncbi:MAG TPA: DinB family protein [bacterium]|nr:DinB family protein [bacterium]